MKRYDKGLVITFTLIITEDLIEHKTDTLPGKVSMQISRGAFSLLSSKAGAVQKEK